MTIITQRLLNFPLRWPKLTAPTLWLELWKSTRTEVLCVCSFLGGGGSADKLFNTLREAYADDTLTGYMVVDTLWGCLLVVFEGGGVGCAEHFTSLPDAYDAGIITGIMLFDTHCGCLSAVFRGVCGGGEEGLVNFQLGWLTLTSSTLWLESWYSTHTEVVCLLSSGGGGSHNKFSYT